MVKLADCIENLSYHFVLLLGIGLLLGMLLGNRSVWIECCAFDIGVSNFGFPQVSVSVIHC